jgi:ABC-2 type transport system ATP-binding protein
MVDNGNAIEVRNVTKSFKVYYDKGRELKERLLFWKRNLYENKLVLDDVSFSVKKGEAIGLVGKNGCGKSTTLKMLTKIIYPNSGEIELKGRVSSLIELGAGFHPDMTGRENIYINASIFGLSKKEIDSRLDEIIAFSELGKAIDNPVRTYSSGMYTRLAFSVAINVDAEILLIDEILAVGDANFQAKCFNKLREIKQSGTTIVIVSHALGQIEQICDRSIWICDGKIQMEGRPKDVHLEYLNYMSNERIEKTAQEVRDVQAEKQALEARREKELKEKGRYGTRDAVFTEYSLTGEGEKPQKIFKTGEKMVLNTKYHVEKKVEDAVFGYGIFRSDGVWCFGTNTRIDGFDNFDIDKDGSFEIEMPHLDLIPGQYWIDITIEFGDGNPVDYFREALNFEVVSNIRDTGICRIAHNWNLG